MSNSSFAADTWARIEEANRAAGWPDDWTAAERDQMQALAEDFNRELLSDVAALEAPSNVLRLPSSVTGCVFDAGRLQWLQMLARGRGIGWRYVDSRSCPRRLVGKRCKGEACYCRKHFEKLNDHGATWFCEWHWGPHQQQFVLWEPYAARAEELAEIVNVANEDRLEVWITASVWNPPRTVGIMFHSRQAPFRPR